MRPQCGVYYYEMHVLSKGNDGYITIGFSTAESHVDRVPGKEKRAYYHCILLNLLFLFLSLGYQGESWGYQGDSGNVYAGSTRGTQYGPGFTTGDIVGCGINFANGTAFYTKNGAFLGVAFNRLDQSAEYYPCIGLRTPGESITVNFGNEPFLYDINQYIKVSLLLLLSSIMYESLSFSLMYIGPKDQGVGRDWQTNLGYHHDHFQHQQHL